MSFFNNVQADETQAQSSYQPIPEGTYKLTVEKCEGAHSKAGNKMVKIQWIVADGEHTGRKLFGNINLEHANPKVVEIGNKQLHALLILCGMASVDEPEEFIGKDMTAKVKVKKREDTGEMQNEVILALPPKGTKPADERAHDTPPAKTDGKTKEDW